MIETVKSYGIKPKRTSFRSPWQNGVAERWVGTGRRDLLDHVIVINERHLKRSMNEYVHYCNNYRPHSVLADRTPAEFAAVRSGDLTNAPVSRLLLEIIT